MVVVMGLTLGAVHYGLGRHIETLEHHRVAHCVKLLRISEFFLITSTVFVKISISLFLKRLLYVLVLFVENLVPYLLHLF